MAQQTSSQDRRANGGEARAAAVQAQSRVPAWAITALALLVGLLLALAIAPGAGTAFADDSDDEEKTSAPTVSIEVAEEDADGALSWGDAADAQVGEAVSYRVTGTLPSNWDDFDSYHYEFDITPDDGLAIDVDSVSVALCDADGNEVADLTDGATITYEDGVLVIIFDDLKALAGEATADCTVLVSYEAALAASSAAAGTDGVAATYAYLVYSSDTDDSGAIDMSAEDSASLYTWALDIAKLAADTGDELLGASFSIRNAEGQYLAADGSLSEEAVELECDEYGALEVVGLDAGEYTVSEVAAPEGYAAVEDFSLTITSDLEDEVELTAALDGEGAELVSVDAAGGVVSIEVSDPVGEGSEGEGSASASDEAAATTASAAAASGSGDGGDDGSGDSGSGSALSSVLSQTGDVLGPVIAALVAAAAAALAVMAVRRRRTAGAEEVGPDAR